MDYIRSMYCCMCPDDVYKPKKIEKNIADGDIYYCENCGLQLTFKRVDTYSDWLRAQQ